MLKRKSSTGEWWIKILWSRGTSLKLHKPLKWYQQCHICMTLIWNYIWTVILEFFSVCYSFGKTYIYASMWHNSYWLFLVLFFKSIASDFIAIRRHFMHYVHSVSASQIYMWDYVAASCFYCCCDTLKVSCRWSCSSFVQFLKEKQQNLTVTQTTLNNRRPMSREPGG